jgi:hypothetical protein
MRESAESGGKPGTATAEELMPRVSLTQLSSLHKASPELADKVVAIVEQRANALSEIETRQQYIQMLGVVSGLAVALMFGYWSFLLLQSGQTIGGSILGTADLGALVTAFIVSGQRKQ